MPHIRTIALGLLLLAFAVTASVPASAHPHVWVTSRSEIVYAPDGTATAVRHHWTFDEMFSAFAVQGLDAKKPGGLTRQDLAPLAEENATSLKEFDYFTKALADGKKAGFVDAADYWMEQRDGILTLHFTLPFKTPVKAKKIDLAIYDASYFIDFSLAKDNPVSTVGAPASCKAVAQGPSGGAAPSAGAAPAQAPESFFENPAASDYGAQFANKISVTC